jgi:hypothetical protein
VVVGVCCLWSMAVLQWGFAGGGTGSGAVRLQVEGSGHNIATQRWATWVDLGHSGLIWASWPCYHVRSETTFGGGEKNPAYWLLRGRRPNQAYNLDWHADGCGMCLHLY